jgi:hypothetical protein
VDSSAFLDRYPEFDRAENLALVEQTLAEVASKLDSAVFGERYDEAHGALTAHTLWSSAFGVSLRLDGSGDGGKSKYWEQYEAIRRAVTVPLTMMVI